MNAPSPRGKWQGMLQILRFNGGFYAWGTTALLVLAAALELLPLPLWLSILAWVGFAVGTWWLIVSVVVSYWVYDASGLMTWRWLALLVPKTPAQWANLHAGLDEATPEITEIWGRPAAVIDFFDEKEMTEPSIHRARALAQNAIGATPASFRNLPVDNAGVDAVTVLFAAHELRSAAAREAFFCELNRILTTGGRLVLVEHLRDTANFIAFGPGFMHFLPRREWLRLAKGAGFVVAREMRRTPFVAAFALQKVGPCSF